MTGRLLMLNSACVLWSHRRQIYTVLHFSLYVINLKDKGGNVTVGL